MNSLMLAKTHHISYKNSYNLLNTYYVPRNVHSLALIYMIPLYEKGKSGLEKLTKFRNIWLASGRARAAICVYFEVPALSIYDSHKKIIPNNRADWERTHYNSTLLTRTNISCIWVKPCDLSPHELVSPHIQIPSNRKYPPSTYSKTLSCQSTTLHTWN